MLQLDFTRYLQESTFKASSYQKAIFQWIELGQGNCVVTAVPGSGKTSTLVEGAKYLSADQASKFLAFNKHIVAELKSKLPKNIKTSTIHGLGFSSLKRHYHRTEVNGKKYSDLCRQYLTDRNISNQQDHDSLSDLIRLAQVNLINPLNLEEIKYLCLYYTIPIKDNWDFWQSAMIEILQKGIELAPTEISFDDMIFLPNALNLSIPTSDWLFIDECQDLNLAQLQLVLKAHKQNTRSLFCGDRNQAIMAFCGADSYSIDNIIEQTNAIQLPLSISYRLPLKHIEIANKLYNVIEPAEGVIDGIVDKIDTDDINSLVQGSDLIICRCFYPLVPVYFSLIRKGIPVQIKNKDISKQLIKLVQTVFGKKNKSYSVADFENKLNQYYQEMKEELTKKQSSLFILANLQDRIKTLIVIYQTRKC